jgi:hypothetical protein
LGHDHFIIKRRQTASSFCAGWSIVVLEFKRAFVKHSLVILSGGKDPSPFQKEPAPYCDTGEIKRDLVGHENKNG